MIDFLPAPPVQRSARQLPGRVWPLLGGALRSGDVLLVALAEARKIANLCLRGRGKFGVG